MASNKEIVGFGVFGLVGLLFAAGVAFLLLAGYGNSDSASSEDSTSQVSPDIDDNYVLLDLVRLSGNVSELSTNNNGVLPSFEEFRDQVLMAADTTNSYSASSSSPKVGQVQYQVESECNQASDAMVPAQTLPARQFALMSVLNDGTRLCVAG